MQFKFNCDYSHISSCWLGRATFSFHSPLIRESFILQKSFNDMLKFDEFPFLLRLTIIRTDRKPQIKEWFKFNSTCLCWVKSGIDNIRIFGNQSFSTVSRFKTENNGCFDLLRHRNRIIHRPKLSLKLTHNILLRLQFINYQNDPSAGSPTDTVLRLLHPLDDKAHNNSLWVLVICRITQSVEATGGVYKGQGRNQHEIMTHPY